jgi:ADP-ribose pyrophosphatase
MAVIIVAGKRRTTKSCSSSNTPRCPRCDRRSRCRPAWVGDQSGDGHPRTAATRELEEETGWAPFACRSVAGRPDVRRHEQRAHRVRACRSLVRTGEGGGVDGEDIIVHAVPRANAAGMG